MKKVLSVILAVILAFGCFSVVGMAAPVHSFMTESGVEVFMETQGKSVLSAENAPVFVRPVYHSPPKWASAAA